MKKRFADTAGRIIKPVLAVILVIVVMEVFSFITLAVVGKNLNTKMLVRKFPAQLRMSSADLKKYVVDDFSVFAKPESAHTAKPLELGFDPAMGFRDLSYIKYFGDKDADIRICVLGGSTTASNFMSGDNWPAHIIESARKAGVRKSVGVLNAGIPGYMSFNEHLFLTNWIMGKLKYRCDVVVSLDGVNDVNYRIVAYAQAEKYGQDWVPAYHGFQQKMDRDVRMLMTTRGAFRQFSVGVAREVSGRALVRVFPYSLRLAIIGARKIGSLNSADGGPERKTQAKAMHVKGFGTNKEGEYTVPKPVRDEIIVAFRNSLLDLAGSCEMRGIPFVSYLQPVHLRKYYDNPQPQGVVDAADRVNIMFGNQEGLTNRFIVDTKPFYSAAEDMYADLRASHPENFSSLIYIFSSHKNEDMYIDSAHYTETGNKIVAEAVVEDLVSRGILPVGQGR